MTTHRTDTRARGMTLVEIVIALAILGMMAALALGGVRLGVRTWETVGQRVEIESHSQIVRAFLRRTLSQATPVLEPGADGRRPRLVFDGEPESLSLVAPLADHLGLGGLQRLELTVEEMGVEAGYRLAMMRSLYYPPGEDGEARPEGEPERHVLIVGAARIRFAYLRELESGARDWSDRWTDEPNLPAAIRLSVEPGRNRLPEPDIIVPVRLTMATARP